MPSVIGGIVGLKPNILPLKFIGENIFQPDFQLHQNGFQFVHSEVMLTMFNAKKRLMGYAGLLRKFGVRKVAPFFSQEFRQLFVQIALHNLKNDKNNVTYA